MQRIFRSVETKSIWWKKDTLSNLSYKDKDYFKEDKQSAKSTKTDNEEDKTEIKNKIVDISTNQMVDEKKELKLKGLEQSIIPADNY